MLLLMVEWLTKVTVFFEKKVFLEFPWVLLYIATIMLITRAVAHLFHKAFSSTILKFGDSYNRDTTSSQFLMHLFKALIYVLGFSVAVYSVPALKTISTSLLAGAGILAVAIGFASQAAFSNIISGLFIVIFRPFSIRDHLFIDQTTFGIVEDITLRHTVLRSPESRRIVVPNSIISSQSILNASLGDPKICKFIEISIGYESDIDQAIAIMRDLLENHPNCVDNRSPEDLEKGAPKVKVKVIQLEESGIRLRAWAWAPDNNLALEMTFDANKALVERFREANIEIPYPHRTIVYK